MMFQSLFHQEMELFLYVLNLSLTMWLALVNEKLAKVAEAEV